MSSGTRYDALVIGSGASGSIAVKELTERGLEEELERLGGLALRQVAGAAELWARLPQIGRAHV